MARKYEAEYIPNDAEDIEDIAYVLVNGKLERLEVLDDDADPIDEED